MQDKELTDKQISAFSKESILKPVMKQPTNRLVPVPPPRDFPLEETKEVQTAEKPKPIRQSTDTMQSASSKMTQDSYTD